MIWLKRFRETRSPRQLWREGVLRNSMKCFVKCVHWFWSILMISSMIGLFWRTWTRIMWPEALWKKSRTRYTKSTHRKTQGQAKISRRVRRRQKTWKGKEKYKQGSVLWKRLEGFRSGLEVPAGGIQEKVWDYEQAELDPGSHRHLRVNVPDDLHDHRVLSETNQNFGRDNQPNYPIPNPGV